MAEESGSQGRIVRLFVSSPSDVVPERDAVSRVAERLNGRLGGAVRIEVDRWEERYYTADSTFQTQIDQYLERADIVVSVFWARLGSELPPGFERMSDDKPYPSGTVYEIAKALEKRADRDDRLPDVLVYRKTAETRTATADLDRRREQDEQFGLFALFWEQWFVSREGHFNAGFQTFRTTEQFEQQFAEHLRQWLDDRGLLDHEILWDIATRGSPFRGLEPFDADHAEVFFGRRRAIDTARDRLDTAATGGCPFLLVSGESGTGKSSLARAGLLPRLTTPGVVEGADLWRAAVMFPGDGPDPVTALTTALFDAGALPELRDSDFAGVESLARHLDGGGAATPIIRAIERAADAFRKRSGLERPATARLLLLIDQMEQLFSSEIDAETRARFARLLADLVESGSVWIVATLRIDALGRLLREPALAALKERGASLELSPPGPAEIAEIVRDPARAAGLVFENRDGTALDDVLIAATEGHNALPLLQFTLQQLYLARDQGDDGRGTLTFAAFDSLGGIEGAIGQEAERAYNKASEAARGRLPRLLRALVAPGRGEDEQLILRSVSMAEFDGDAPARELIDALVEARILVTGGDERAPTLRLAHERVLDSWPEAARIVKDARTFLRVRETLGRRRGRWHEKGRPRDLLLPAGLELAEAESIAQRFRDELDPDLRAFVEASGRRARFRQRFATAAAVVFALLALVAGWQTWEADEQRRRAERNVEIAVRTADQFAQALSEEVVRDLRIPSAELNELIRTTDRSFADLIEQVGATPELIFRHATLLLVASETHFILGNVRQSHDEASRAIALLAEMTATRAVQVALARGHVAQGHALIERGAIGQARTALEAAGDLIPDGPDRSDDWLVVAADYAHARGLIGYFEANVDASIEWAARLDELAGRLQGADLEFEAIAARFRHHLIRAHGLAHQMAYRDAVDALDRALAEADNLIARNPQSLRWAHERADTIVHRAELLLNANAWSESAGDIARARETIADLMLKDPDNARWRLIRSRLLTGQGRLFHQVSNLPQAAARHGEALTILTALLHEEPNWARAVLQHTTAAIETVRVEIDRGDHEASEQALALTESVVTQSEIEPAHVVLGRISTLVAFYKGERTRVQDNGSLAALEHFRACIGQARENLARGRNSHRLRHDLGFCQHRVAIVLDSAEQPVAAEQAYRETVETWQDLTGEDGHLLAGSLLVSTLNSLGRLIRNDDRYDEAEAVYRRALAVSQRMSAQEPATASHRSDEAYTYGELARLNEIRGEIGSALVAYKQAIDIVMTELARDVSNSWFFESIEFYRTRTEEIRDLLDGGVDSLSADRVADLRRLAQSILSDSDANRVLIIGEYETSDGVILVEDRQSWLQQPFMPGAWYEITDESFDEMEGRFLPLLAERALNSPTIIRMRALPLPFYPDGEAIEAEVVTRDGRIGVATIVRQADDYVLMDGTSPAIHEMNVTAPVQLDRVDRVAAYLRFFTGLLQGEEGRFSFIDRAEDIRWRNDAGAALRSNVDDLILPFIVKEGTGGDWQAAATVQYADALFNAALKIERSGLVTMNTDTPVAVDLPIGRYRFDAGLRHVYFPPAGE